MLADKLLLNAFVILTPVLAYGFFFERFRFREYPILFGVIQGLAASLCMLLSFNEYDMYWDLRYIPLVVAFVYGGRLSGGVAAACIMLTRVYVDVNDVWYGLSNILAAVSIPFILSGQLSRLKTRRRVSVTLLMSAWPLLATAAVYFIYSYKINKDGPEFKLMFHDALISVITFSLTLLVVISLFEIMMERMNMRSYLQRAEKLTTIGELAASFAHEVRNPLTVVKGFVQLMQRDKQPYPHLPLVMEEIERAEAIISDYLNFAKPQIRKTDPFELRQMLGDVVTLLTPLAVKQGVELGARLSGNPTLHTDRYQLQQALVNIIKNALEATGAGGKVTVALRTLDDQAVIRITDTGKGMTQEELARLGTLFYSTKEKGTGLGTSVTIRIIEAMQGTISYTSKPNAGTEVLVILPIEEPEQSVTNF